MQVRAVNLRESDEKPVEVAAIHGGKVYDHLSRKWSIPRESR
jgi:hypothetical protein